MSSVASQGPTTAVNPTGNPTPLNMDGAGNLKVAVTGAGAGGTSSVDESTFTPAVSAGTPIMAAVNPTGGLPNNDLAVLACDANRNLKVAGSFSSTPPSSNTSSVPAQQTIGTTSVQVIAANASRKGLSIQNTGTTVLKLGLGQTPTQTAYHIALRAGGAADDGSSERWDGTISGVVWTGAVNAISPSAGGTVVVTELT